MSTPRRKRAPDWVPPVEYLNDLGGYVRTPIEFANRQLDLIQKYLPPTTDPERIKLLPCLFREWGQLELRWSLSGMPLAVLAEQRMRLGKVAKRAAALIKALDELNQALDDLPELDRWALVDQLGLAEGLSGHTAYRHQKNKERLDEWRSLTKMLSTAASQRAQTPKSGRPRRIAAQLVLMDLAALFEYLTGLSASRSVARSGKERGQETGPFLEFARAVWPVIFECGDRGLISQLRDWADDGSKKSALIYSIAARRPEWGLLPKP